MRFLTMVLTTAVLGSSAHAACTAQAQDRQAAQTVAKSAAQQQLGSAATLYSFLYDKVSYNVSVGQTQISGDSAQVRGHVLLSGIERRTGKPAQGNYAGTVYLKKDAACAWRVTGYKRE